MLAVLALSAAVSLAGALAGFGAASRALDAANYALQAALLLGFALYAVNLSGRKQGGARRGERPAVALLALTIAAGVAVRWI